MAFMRLWSLLPVLVLAASAALADSLPEWVAKNAAGPWPFRVLQIGGDGTVCGVVTVVDTTYPACIRDRFMELPGMGRRAECQYERELADEAALWMRVLLTDAPVHVADLGPANTRRGWTGRIERHYASDLAAELISMGLARHPEIPDQPWCGW
jgi:hypothetical protein